MDFPHLKDTNFPDINGVNVYKYQNNFDYARWQGKVNYKLINVKWNSVYNDVPYFNTVEERDAWFDSQEGYIDTLESIFNNTPKNSLKVPLPFNDAYHYNYIVIDMPVQTSESQPLNYANDSMRVKRWFYFIEDMNQLSPSTTELQLSIDYWTTFVNTVSIPYLMLERGHAPMMQTKVNDYLANPIANNEYLLAADFNYGNETIIQTSNYIPIGNGKKYVLFCAPYHKDDFSKFDSTAYSGNSTPPTFSDTAERWGYQITVNGYEWKYGDADYSGADLPIHNNQQTGLPNGCECFAIDSIYATQFFNYMAKYHTHFIHGIKAMFMLDESLISLSQEFTFNGYTLYIADRKMNNMNLSFNKNQFGFDKKYSDIAKLYTFPYSALEITDDEGNIFTARIENCGNVKMYEEVSLVYPYLNYNVFFSGINGDGTMAYTWMNVRDETSNKTMWASDFSKFMMNWNVPVYSIFVSAEDEYAANNAAGMAARRQGAIIEYQNAVRYANTTCANTADTMATNTSNVNASTATDVANTADAMTALDNQTLNNNNRDVNITTNNNDMNAYQTNAAISKAYDDYAEDNSVTAAGIQVNIDAFGLSMVANGISSVGSVASNPLNGASGLIGGACSSIVALSKDAALANAASQASLNKQGIYATYMTNVNQKLRDTHSANNREIVSTMIANAVITEDLQNGNAARSKTTNDANASRTQGTETANAGYTRNATIEAEQDNLRQKQREAEAQYKNSRLHPPAQYSAYSGDFGPDAYMRRGVRFNIRTQSKSAIAQAGDAMLRFGYALHRVWDMDNGFHYGKNFTYWKAEDIWINDGTGVANVATNAIANILLSGVTVWKDPDKIGTIGIYDNI